MKKVLLFFALLMLTHTVGATITISNDATTGIVTIEQTSAREIGYALQNNTLSVEERNMITSANGFVLSGPFMNDPDLMQLSQKNGSIKVLDMGDCIISPTNRMIPTVWQSTLEEIVIPTHSSFNKLPQNFLEGFTKIKTITIPANIKTIENMALANMTISEITIPATLDRIKEGAFAQTIVLHDVYVESRHTVCDLNAFDFETLVGQTSVENIYTYAAKLHYPDTPEDYEYFVGSWKEGRTLRQDQLNGFKDGLWEWNGFYVEYVGPWNGWQQFALSDNSEPFVMKNNIVRTYSDSYEHDYLPTGSRYEIRVYRVNNYSKNNNRALLQRVRGTRYCPYDKDGWNCIPANTGVIIKVITDGNNYLHYFTRTNNNIKTYPWTWNGGGNTTNNNLLEKAVDETSVAPVWPWPKTSNVEYRNFCLQYNGKYYWSRLTESIIGPHKAYLKMPSSVFTNNNEGPGEGPGDNTLAKVFMSFSTTTSQGNSDDITFVFPDDEPTNNNYQSEMHFLYADPNDVVIPSNNGIATNVNNVVKREDNSYYTLQGIMVGLLVDKHWQSQINHFLIGMKISFLKKAKKKTMIYSVAFGRINNF